jgi:hypothetical protein
MLKNLAICALCFGIKTIDWVVTKKERVYEGRVVMKKRFLRGWKATELPPIVCYMITYIYNSRKYIYVTYDPEFDWPPPPNEGASFILPIKSAIDTEGNDHTTFIKRLAGPRGDFHGKKIRLYHVMGHITLIIEDILGNKRTIEPSDFI